MSRVTKIEKASSEGVLDSFVRRLETFARNLSEREQKILIAILQYGIDPLDKIVLSLTDESKLLSEEEEEFLRSLDNRDSDKQ